MNKLDIIFAPDFVKKLNEITEYYSDLSDTYVRRLLNELEIKCKLVSLFPYITPAIMRNENFRKLIIKNRFIIIYKIHKDKLEFVDFIDGRIENNNLELNEQIEMVYIV